MNSAFLLIIAIVVLTAGYFFYGGFLNRIFGVDPSKPTPAHTHKDGVDFEPAKHWTVLFGHHFSAIAGAGPVVGPAIAAAYWGWGPALLWLLIGSIFIGGVADFASLFMSVRSRGQSIAASAHPEISPRARICFIVFIWLALLLVIAVFSIFCAKTFIAEPTSVIPSVGLIPAAIFFGWLLYWKNVSNRIATPIGLLLLLVLLFIGNKIPIQLGTWGPFTAETIWILVLLVYCFTASVVPVQILLQPRDYLASFILFFLIGLGVVSVFIVHPTMSGTGFAPLLSTIPSEAGSLWPMLFVTIACGAVSGFHAVVASGTTSKQIGCESNIRRIGYGSMLVETLLGVLVLICVGGSLAHGQLGPLLKSGGPIAVFSEGFGNLSSFALGGYGKAFAVLALNAFILTTLDAATRITRYLTTELFGISNKYLATAIVVVLSGLLALTGQWAVLWPIFGTANQLIAGVALLVASCWLLNRAKSVWFALIPAGIMLLVTLGAFFYQFVSALEKPQPDFVIAGLSVGLVAVALTIIFEALKKIVRGPRKRKSHDLAADLIYTAPRECE